MANLYDLMDEYAAIQEAIEADAPEEEIERLIDAMDESRGELEGKVDSICRLLRNLEADTGAQKNEETRLATRRKAIERSRARLRKWVMQTMDLLEVDKIKTSLHTVSLAEGKESVIIVDDEKVPDEFKTTTVVVDKRAIMKAYKSDGEVVDGCDIVKGDPILTIR